MSVTIFKINARVPSVWRNRSQRITSERALQTETVQRKLDASDVINFCEEIKAPYIYSIVGLLNILFNPQQAKQQQQFVNICY